MRHRRGTRFAGGVRAGTVSLPRRCRSTGLHGVMYWVKLLHLRPMP